MVTFSPVWLAVPFQALVMCWSPGKVNFSVQPLSAAVPVLVIVTLAVKPPVHWLVVEYVTWQAPLPPPPPDELTAQVNAADPDAPVVSVAVTVAG